MKATLLGLGSIVAVLVCVSSGWGYSFDSRSVTAENGDYAKVIWPSEQNAEKRQGEDILTGSYNGTTYTITLNKDHFPGMCSFPFGVHYGESSRYVGLDDKSTQPVAQTSAISEEEAKRLLDAQ